MTKEYKFSALLDNEKINISELGEKFREYLKKKGASLDEKALAGLNEEFIEHFRRTVEHERRKNGEISASSNHFLALAMTDALSWLDHAIGNRETFLNPNLLSKSGMEQEFVDTLKENAKNPDAVVVLVNFDIDGFKVVNDEYGHPTGDSVIKGTGKALGEAVRSTDSATHYSGDEFGILLKMSRKAILKQIVEDGGGEEVVELLGVDQENVLINQKIQSIIEKIIKKTCKLAPTYTAEFELGKEYNEDAVKKLAEKKPLLGKIEISAGYRVILPQELAQHTKPTAANFKNYSDDCEKALEKSKIINAISLLDEKSAPVESSERVISYHGMEEVDEKYDEKTLKRAKAYRFMKRGFVAVYGDTISASFMSQIIEEALVRMDAEAARNAVETIK